MEVVTIINFLLQVTLSQFHKREVEVLESLRSDRFKPEFYGIIIEGGEVRIFMELIGE